MYGTYDKYIFRGLQQSERKNVQNLSSDELLYGIDDTPSISTQILLGLQNIFRRLWRICLVPLVISSALGFNGAVATAVLSASILARLV